MRFLLPVFILLCSLVCSGPSFSDEITEASPRPSVSEEIKGTVRPLLEAFKLIGTPYKYGGSNPEKGIDCSGLVKRVYKDSANITLPRTAAEMSQQGDPVEKSDLKPGDLVFFNTRKKRNSHVGIYAGDGAFVHASSGAAKEVTISNIAEKYWAKHFNGARRVLPAE